MASIQAMLAGAPTDEEKMQAMAGALRGKKRAADLFSMSTLAPVAGAAKAELGNVMDSAKRGGVLRQANKRDEEARRLSDQAQNNWEREFAYNKTKDADTNALRQSIAELRSKGSGGTGAWRNKITSKEMETMENTANEYAQKTDVFNRWQSDFSEGKIPKLGALKNWTAMNAPIFTNEKEEQAATWWSDYLRFSENVVRHKLFGSALTAPEIKEWKKLTPNPDMEDDDIQRMLGKQREFLDERARRHVDIKRMSGVPEEAITALFGEGMGTSPRSVLNVGSETGETTGSVDDDLSGDIREGDIAENPTTGETLIFRGGEWENM